MSSSAYPIAAIQYPQWQSHVFSHTRVRPTQIWLQILGSLPPGLCTETQQSLCHPAATIGKGCGHSSICFWKHSKRNKWKRRVAYIQLHPHGVFQLHLHGRKLASRQMQLLNTKSSLPKASSSVQRMQKDSNSLQINSSHRAHWVQTYISDSFISSHPMPTYTLTQISKPHFDNAEDKRHAGKAISPAPGPGCLGTGGVEKLIRKLI